MENVLTLGMNSKKFNRKTIIAAKVFITLAFLGYIISLISFKDMGRSLSQINLYYLVFLILLFFVFILLGAVNNYLIILSIARIHFVDVLKIFCMGVSVGMFTPAYIGELSTITYLLSKRGMTLGEGLSVPGIDKFLTIIVASIFWVIGLWLYFPDIGIYIYILILLGLMLSLMLLFLRPLRKLVRKKIVEPFFPWAVSFLNSFVSFFLNHMILVLLNLLGTVARALVGAFMIWVGLFALGVHRGVWDVILINFVARIVSYVPVTINGLGLLESAAIKTFSRLDIAPEPILLAFLIDRAIAALFGLSVICFMAGKKGAWILRSARTN